MPTIFSLFCAILTSLVLSPPLFTRFFPICFSPFCFFLNLLPTSCFSSSLSPLLSSDLLTEWITDPNSPAHKRLAWMLSSIMDGCSRTMSWFDLRYVVNMYREQKKHTFIPSLTSEGLPTSENLQTQPINVRKSAKNDVIRSGQSCSSVTDNVNWSIIWIERSMDKWQPKKGERYIKVRKT